MGLELWLVSGRLVWCDGEVVAAADATVSSLDRTLLYGLGAFETVHLYRGKPFMIERHMARLRGGLAGLGLREPAALAALPAGIEELARRTDGDECMCRVTVTAGADASTDETGDVGDGHAVAGRRGLGQRVLAHMRDLPPLPPPGQVAVGIAEARHEADSPIAGLKATSYLVHYLLRERAEAGGRVDDLLLDHAGNVQEATVSNVFFVEAGTLVTPTATEGILPGITRGLVLEFAGELGLPLAERRVPASDLSRFDECFLTGAGKGLLSVDLLDGRRLPDARPVTTLVRRAYRARVAAVCGHGGAPTAS